jgi:hypothetical protein
MMTKTLSVLVISVALAACGGKAKKSTTPDNKAGASQTDKSSGSMGGASYGGKAAPTAPPASNDPCGGS